MQRELTESALTGRVLARHARAADPPRPARALRARSRRDARRAARRPLAGGRRRSAVRARGALVPARASRREARQRRSPRRSTPTRFSSRGAGLATRSLRPAHADRAPPLQPRADARPRIRVRPRGRRRERKPCACPSARSTCRSPPDETRWVGWRLEQFVPAADLRVRGLQNRYRHAGIGAPLSASLGEPSATRRRRARASSRRRSRCR